MAVYTINTHGPSPRKPGPRKPTSQWTITAVGALVVTAVGLLGWWLWPEHVPSPEASPVTLVKFASSDRFAHMPDQEKQPYIDALTKDRRAMFAAAREANLSQDERMNAMENVMGARMQKQLDAFFALPMGAQRDAYLDKMIDEQERNMREWMQRAATRPARTDGGGGGGPNGTGGEARNRQGRGQGGQNMYSAERIKRRIENTPPARRAQAAEFWAAMRARREARGLPTMRGPRG